MAKSKEFKIKRGIGEYSYKCWLFYLNSNIAVPYLCYKSIVKFFGIKLEPSESKRIRITIEEVK